MKIYRINGETWDEMNRREDRETAMMSRIERQCSPEGIARSERAAAARAAVLEAGGTQSEADRAGCYAVGDYRAEIKNV